MRRVLMTSAPTRLEQPGRSGRSRLWTLALMLLVLGCVAFFGINRGSFGKKAVAQEAPPNKAEDDRGLEPGDDPRQVAKVNKEREPEDDRVMAPELEGGVAWLNTAGPV